MIEVKFVKSFLLTDAKYCIMHDPDSGNWSEDIVETYEGQDAVIIEEMGRRGEGDKEVFIYIPEYDWGSYVLEDFVEVIDDNN